MRELEENVIYTITDESGKVVLKLRRYEDTLNNKVQIHLETADNVYDGPVDYLFADK